MSAGVRAPDALPARALGRNRLSRLADGVPFHLGHPSAMRQLALPRVPSRVSVLARTPALISERSATTQTDPLPSPSLRTPPSEFTDASIESGLNRRPRAPRPGSTRAWARGR